MVVPDARAGGTKGGRAAALLLGAAAGFTLIELLAVMVLVAILTAVAMPRFTEERAFDEIGYREELAAAARYAQKRALTSGCPVRLTVTATSYELRQPDAFPPCAPNYNAPVLHPATGEAFTGSAAGGLTVTASLSLPLDVVFDARGATNLPGTVEAVTFTLGGSAVRIHRATGYVEIP